MPGDDERRRRPLLHLDWDRLALIAFVALEVVVAIALLLAVVFIATD